MSRTRSTGPAWLHGYSARKAENNGCTSPESQLAQILVSLTGVVSFSVDDLLFLTLFDYPDLTIRSPLILADIIVVVATWVKMHQHVKACLNLGFGVTLSAVVLVDGMCSVRSEAYERWPDINVLVQEVSTFCQSKRPHFRSL